MDDNILHRLDAVLVLAIRTELARNLHLAWRKKLDEAG